MKIQERHLTWSYIHRKIENTSRLLSERGYSCSVCSATGDLRLNPNGEIVCRKHCLTDYPAIVFVEGFAPARNPEGTTPEGGMPEDTALDPPEGTTLDKPKLRLKRYRKHRVPQDVREALMVRANSRCERCGRDHDLHVHHKIPIRL